MTQKQIAAMFKALGDENRIQIIELLIGGEKCACNLLNEIKITQPTLSHHMKILCDAGVVECWKEGKWTHYKIAEEGIASMMAYLEKLKGNEVADKEKSCCCKG